MVKRSLAELEAAVRSDERDVRNAAMIELVDLARKDRKRGDALLPIFRDAVEHPRDGWTTANAIRGIEAVCGNEHGRQFRAPLFGHPDPAMAVPAIQTSPDVGCVPALIATLSNRPEVPVRIAVLQTFARLRDPATLQPMVDCLASPDLRPYAIESLGYLGDPRAIPSLELWLGDTTQTWPEDDRGGPMMTVGYMAGAAIGKIRFQSGRLTPQAGVDPVKGRAELTAPRRSRLPMAGHWLPFIPLAAAVFTVPWVFLVAILSLDPQGHLTTTPERTHAFDLMCAAPAAVGLVTGFCVPVLRRPLHGWRWTVLALGLALCGLAMFCFGRELFH